MKKILLTIGLLLSLNYAYAQAQLPDSFTVVSSQAPGGIGDVACRKVFDIYNKMYKSNSVIFNKIGGFGAVAQREVITSNKFSAGCGPGTESWLAPILYNLPDVEKIRVVTNMIALTDFYYVSTKNSAQTYLELIENAKRDKRTITIGGPLGHILKMEYVLRQNNVNYTIIPYQKMSDMLPSLIDGTLDLAADAGTLLPMAREGKIKSIGYINIADWPNGVGKNHLKHFPGVSQWIGTFMIYTSKSIPDDQFEEFAHRVIKVIKSEEFSEWALSKDVTPFGDTSKQAELFVEKARQSYLKFKN